MRKPLILLLCWTAAVPSALLAETPAAEILAAEMLANEMLAVEAPPAEAPVAKTRVAGPVDEPGASEMMSTTWTLDDPAPPPVAAAPGSPGSATAKAAKPRKARVFGGARASNSRQKSRKAGANVGVALPF